MAGAAAKQPWHGCCVEVSTSAIPNSRDLQLNNVLASAACFLQPDLLPSRLM